MNARPYGEVLDEMDHHAKYQPATAARRLALSEQDFRKLIAGEIVERDGVSIILSDIGWTTMHDAIWDVLKAKQQQRAPR